MLATMLRASGGIAVPVDYIARWDMNSDATDETGNYDITLNGGAVQNSDHVDYDGVNDYGQCTRLALNSNAFTIVIRFRFDVVDATTAPVINSRSSNSVTSEMEFQLNRRSSPSDQLAFSVWNSSSIFSVFSTTSILANTWYVYSLRFTGTNVELLNETTQEDSTAFTGSMNTGSLFTRFGEVIGLYGNLDQSRGIVYDYSLSDSELSAAVNKVKNGW